MKSFLAFKGVTNQYNSAWLSANGCQWREPVRKKLMRKYLVGKTVKPASEFFPLWLVDRYSNNSLSLNTGVDHLIKRVLLVRVPASALTDQTRYLWNSDGQTVAPDLRKMRTKSYVQRNLAAKELEVLEEVDLNKFQSVDEAMAHFEAKYGWPRATLDDVPESDSKN